MGLFAGACDRRYVESRVRVGAAHERIGLAPKWYIGAYCRHMRLFHGRLVAGHPPAEATANYLSFSKLVAFDMALAIDGGRDPLIRTGGCSGWPRKFGSTR